MSRVKSIKAISKRAKELDVPEEEVKVPEPAPMPAAPAVPLTETLKDKEAVIVSKTYVHKQKRKDGRVVHKVYTHTWVKKDPEARKRKKELLADISAAVKAMTVEQLTEIQAAVRKLKPKVEKKEAQATPEKTVEHEVQYEEETD